MRDQQMTRTNSLILTTDDLNHEIFMIDIFYNIDKKILIELLQ